MAHVHADRVADTTTLTGTGNCTVATTPPLGFRTLSAVLTTNDTFWYCIAHQTENEWEVGLGTYNGSNVFVRTTVYGSSNSNSAVNFSAGVKDVFITTPAAAIGFLGSNLNFSGYAATNALFLNSANSASVQVARFDGDRSAPANNDAAYLSFYLSDSGGTQTEFGRLTWQAINVTDTSESGLFSWSAMIAGTLTSVMQLTGAALRPTSNGGIALGTTTLGWSNLHGADGFALNIAGGDWVVQHSTGIMTVTTGDFRVTNSGTDGTSVVTNDGTQTLTNKTLTAPTMTTPALGTVASGNLAACDAASTTAKGVVELATTAEALTGTDTARAVTPAGVAAATIMQGRHTLWIPAAAMTGRVTAGASRGIVELATNDVVLMTIDFDTTTEEGVGFMIAMPKSWNEGTITFAPYWTAASGSGGVVFGMQAYALSNDDAMDTAPSGQQTSTDTLITANDCHIGPESSAITIGGSPAANDLVYFEITREVANGSDTLGVDAKLIGVQIFLDYNLPTDV